MYHAYNYTTGATHNIYTNEKTGAAQVILDSVRPGYYEEGKTTLFAEFGNANTNTNPSYTRIVEV